MRPFRAFLTAILLAFPGSGPRVPNFDRAIALEGKAETTANASLGDLNGDGHLDIVLAKGRHRPLVDLVLLNDRRGRFSRRHNLSNRADRTYSAALADLNGDGRPDLVVGNDAPDAKAIFYNDGKGIFTFAGAFGDARWPARNVAVADLNRDGRPDIVVANRSEDRPGFKGTSDAATTSVGEGRFTVVGAPAEVKR